MITPIRRHFQHSPCWQLLVEAPGWPHVPAACICVLCGDTAVPVTAPPAPAPRALVLRVLLLLLLRDGQEGDWDTPCSGSVLGCAIPAMLCRAVPSRAVLCRAMLCCATLVTQAQRSHPRKAVPYCAVQAALAPQLHPCWLCHAVPFRLPRLSGATPAGLDHTVPCHAAPCPAMPCCAMPCCESCPGLVVLCFPGGTVSCRTARVWLCMGCAHVAGP